MVFLFYMAELFWLLLRGVLLKKALGRIRPISLFHQNQNSILTRIIALKYGRGPGTSIEYPALCRVSE